MHSIRLDVWNLVGFFDKRRPVSIACSTYLCRCNSVLQDICKHLRSTTYFELIPLKLLGLQRRSLNIANEPAFYFTIEL